MKTNPKSIPLMSLNRLKNKINLSDKASNKDNLDKDWLKEWKNDWRYR